MFAGELVSVIAERDVIRVSWATPSGFFTMITLMQCSDSVDTPDVCISHDVTDVITFSVSRSDGTLLTLVVWQDRDDVLSHQVHMFSEANDSNSGEGRGIYNCEHYDCVTIIGSIISKNKSIR